MSELVMDQPEDNAGGKLKGIHVLFWMLGFFGLMFAVNGVFLYHAITSFPGEDVKNSYVQGLNYNDTLEARAAQQARGWQAEAGILAEEIVFQLADRDGAPVSGYNVIAELRRRATNEADIVLVLQPSGLGQYAQTVRDLSPGRWVAEFRVLDDSSQTPIFVAEKSLELQ